MEARSPSPQRSSVSPPSAQQNMPRDAGCTPRTKRKRSNEMAGEASPPETSPIAETEDSSNEDIYDPDQPLAERRRVQKSFRDLLRDVTENSEEYLQTGSHGLYDTIMKANELTKQVKQTTEATIDSRLLVSTTDLSYRKTLRLTQGSLSQGVDVDEFVSKCITFMRQEMGNAGGEAHGTLMSQVRQSREISTGIEDSDDRDGDMMNWCHMGRFGCLPHTRRPALSGLLLGPLSVERKLRKVTKRGAPFRPNNLTETRPEILNLDNLAKKENDLTAICGMIFQQLQVAQIELQEAVEAAIDDDMSDEEKMDVMHKHGLRSTGGIDLMKFVVNPKSFGQTVENLFYVSFLIRDGRIEVDYDEFDLPALAPVAREEHNHDVPVRQGSAKYQAVLSIDMQAWQDIVQTLQIKEPMIKHRQEAVNTGPGAKGWYS